MNPIPYLIATLIFGTLGTITDLKKSVIKNWMIIVMVVTKITIDSILISTKNVSFSDITYTYINMGAALIVSTLLWLIGFWSPGDAKFFSAMIGFIPISMYPANKLVVTNVIPFIIIPAVLILLLTAFFKSSRKQKFDAAMTIFEPKKLIANILSIFWISWMVASAGKMLMIKLNPAVYFLSFLAVNYLLNKYLAEKKLYLSLIFSIMRLLFDFQQIRTVDFWISFMISAMIFVILLGILSYLGKNYFIPRKKPLEKIFPGTFVAENIILKRKIDNIKSYKIVKAKNREIFSPRYLVKKNLPYFLDIESMKKSKFFPKREDLKYLFSSSDKELYSEKKELLEKFKIKFLIVEDSIVFGPYIFAGIIIFLIYSALRLSRII